MRIRFAEADDLTDITRLINEAFSIERSFRVGDRITFGEVRSLFRKGRFFLVEEGVEIRGCVYVELRGDRVYLGLLSAKPSHQRSGIGSRLAAAAEEYACECGCQFMDLRIVSLRQELSGIYRRLGYEPTGIQELETELTPHFTQPVHFIVMTKQLEPFAPPANRSLSTSNQQGSLDALLMESLSGEVLGSDFV
jgi:GNAT superfamily N-acetyltransferase